MYEEKKTTHHHSRQNKMGIPVKKIIPDDGNRSVFRQNASNDGNIARDGKKYNIE